jgi:hypothetical protein
MIGPAVIALTSTTNGLSVKHNDQRIHCEEDHRYRLLVIGDFYIRDSTSMCPRENTRLLLHLLSSSNNADLAMQNIHGGIYALVIIDKLTNSAKIMVDAHGYFPLYCLCDGNSLLLADNQTVLCSRIDALPMYEFLRYGYLPFSDSFCSTVRRFQPRHIAEVRALPGGTLKIAHDYREIVPEKPPTIFSTDEAATQLHAAFGGYFSRIPDSSVMAGLSGGYDSRLIAAYLRDRSLKLVNFGNPNSLEVRCAKQTAEALDFPLTSYTVSLDSVYSQAVHWTRLMRIPSSLEYSHVGVLAQQVRNNTPDYYVDGFLGGARIGSSYFYKIGNRPNLLLKNLFFLDSYANPLRNADFYQDLLLNDLTNLPRSEFSRLNESVCHADLEQTVQTVAGKTMSAALTHEWLTEKLRLEFRAKSLITNGPTSISTYTTCLCPFNDSDILSICERTAKHLRAGDRLYNAFWRLSFPDLCDIPKNNTGGRARQANFNYRARHAIQATLRNIVFPAIRSMTRGRVDFTEPYFSVIDYALDARNRTIIDSGLDFLIEHESSIGLRFTEDREDFCRNFPTLALRLATLSLYQTAIANDRISAQDTSSMELSGKSD